MSESLNEEMKNHHLAKRRGEIENERTTVLKLPILLNGLDGPVELFTKSLGEELFNRNVELLRENHGETRINIILHSILAICQDDQCL